MFGNSNKTLDEEINDLNSNKLDKTTVATSSTLGLVKSGTDITVDSSGNVSVNDDSHNHVISNVDGLQNELDGKAASSHSHNYAGSSSSGGSATSAVKLDSSAGSATQPVYFSDGKPVACNFIYEEGRFKPKFWDSSNVEQTFGAVSIAYKRIGNLCYIYIYALITPGAISVKKIDNLPFEPDNNVHPKYVSAHEKGTVFANGEACYVNMPEDHGQIILESVATINVLVVEGIYSV